MQAFSLVAEDKYTACPFVSSLYAPILTLFLHYHLVLILHLVFNKESSGSALGDGSHHRVQAHHRGSGLRSNRKRCLRE